MKLRLRSLLTNQTLKLEVPETCNLQQLIGILSESFSSPSPSPPRFSLNRKDELLGSSPLNPLRSLGITSGDLIYFSFDANDFSPVPTETLGAGSCSSSMASSRGQLSAKEGCKNLPAPSNSGNFRASDAFDSKGSACDVNCGLSSEISRDSGLMVVSNTEGESSNVNFGVDEHRSITLGGKSSGTVKSDEDDCMDIDGASSVNAIGISERFSQPYFLRWVLRAELGACDSSYHKLLFAAVHAVFLESGFVGYDSVSGSRMEQFHFDKDWPSMWSALSVSYTLPQLQGKDVISIALKFRTLGNFLNVFGSLVTSGANTYRLCLNGKNLVPTLHLLWANSQKRQTDSDGSLEAMDYSHESQVFKFWKDVKDGLCLPLLIDLCDKAGLPLPSCFLSLPTDLKLSILKLLPGVDVARMECVSLEMRYLSSNNELWNQKFAEEFGSEQLATYPMINWKQRFVSELEWSRKRKREEEEMAAIRWSVPGIRRDPNPLGYPAGGILGGDYDRIPGLGIPLPFPRVGPGLGMPPFFTQHIGPGLFQGGRRTSRNMRTNCDF
ncbi:unnamed protein product [Linum trigynum]|uniref:F-box domain-containing protein n=1 Tax=Linum trigynum TaxID=586398 RepID=A0AAV2CKM0_9ROSI